MNKKLNIGKTLIGCVWAKAFTKTFDGIKVYIIAPVSLKAEWKRIATEATGLKCEEEKKKSKSKAKTKTKIKTKTKTKTKVKTKNKVENIDESHDVEIFSWAKVPAAIPKSVSNYIVICDEAHNMQSMDSARTKDTLSLVLAPRYENLFIRQLKWCVLSSCFPLTL